MIWGFRSCPAVEKGGGGGGEGDEERGREGEDGVSSGWDTGHHHSGIQCGWYTTLPTYLPNYYALKVSVV